MGTDASLSQFPAYHSTDASVPASPPYRGTLPDAELREIEAARAREYRLVSALLAGAPSQELLTGLARIEGDETSLGAAHGALARAARMTDAKAEARGYFDLFVGVGRGELLPYASYYLTGFLNERPLAAVRRDLAALGLARADGRHDPEDHVATLCDVMAALAAGDSPELAPGGAPDARGFFARHLEPWAGRFFADLTASRRSAFYSAVGALGAAFIGIESAAFALDGAPVAAGEGSRAKRN